MLRGVYATARGCSLAVAFFCTLLLSAPPIDAANLSVSPLRVELAPDEGSAVLTLGNNGDQPVVVQLDTVSWTQESGKDIYTPTRDFVASPPVFTLDPGGVQLIRVGLRKTHAVPERELTYRLFLQEVPGANTSGKNVVQMALRISLPVFVQPKEVVSKQEWSAQRLADGRVRLRLSNPGNVRIQVTALHLLQPGQQKPLASISEMSYVLAGQTREWLLTPSTPLAPSLTMLRLQAATDGGRIEQDVPLQQP